MEYRKYKTKQVSLLGFGCMRMPIIDNDNSKIDYDKASKLIDEAILNGINYFDTAYTYHGDTSESFIGKALSKYPRESYNLTTKMPPFRVKSIEDVDRIFNEQLKNCKVDYFDFYLIHSLSEKNYELSKKYEIYEYLEKQKENGKIKNLGFSFHDELPVLKQIVEEHDWDFAQIQLNYIDYEMQNAKAQYEVLTEKNIPVIVMEPVKGGILAKLSEKAAKVLNQADENASLASWAVRYAASFENVLTVLSGMSNMAQLKDNIKSMTNFKPISKSEQEKINQAVDEFRKSASIPCTACNYCMPCPFGVDIPKVFAIYNNHQTRENPQPWMMDLENRVLGKSHQAHNCTNCQKCIPKCPQKIAIPTWMNKIKEI